VARDQCDVRAPTPCRASEGNTHLAAAVIGDEPDGIDWLPRRSGRHNYLFALESGLALQQPADLADDFFGLGHSPGTTPFSDRKGSFAGLQNLIAERAHLFDVAFRLRVGPHPIVHRRDQQNLRCRRQQAGGEQIVSESMGGAADEISSRRRYDDDLCFSRESDVIECMAGTEYLGVHRTTCDSFECDRTDELSRPASHHYIYFSAGLCKQTRQPH